MVVMVCPRHRSAISLLTPARLNRVRAVRRRSWIVQPVTPETLSNRALTLLHPAMGRLSLVGNIQSSDFANKVNAALDNGTRWAILVLYRSAGMTQSAPETS